jgi:hypothetical protein
MDRARWQDVANIVVGAWLIVSPWLLGIGEDEFAEAWNAYAIGGSILLLSALALPLPGDWEEVLNFGLGTWLVASPWVLEFTAHRLVAANAMIAGCLVIALAAWAIGSNHGAGAWWRHDRQAVP